MKLMNAGAVRRRFLAAALTTALGWIIAACDSTAIREPWIVGGFGPKVTSLILAPVTHDGLRGGSKASLNIAFTSGKAPHTLSVDFGGAAPNIIDVPASSPWSGIVTFYENTTAQQFTLTTRIKDSRGVNGEAATYTFNVLPSH